MGAKRPKSLVPIYLQPEDANLWYFKLLLFNITEFIAWNILKIPLTLKPGNL